MNILWLDLAARVGKYDTWLHTDFAVELRKYVDNLFFYAPEMHNKYDQTLVPIQYHPNLLMRDIVNELKIDVIVSNTRSAMYYPTYHPKVLCPELPSVGDCWLPEDFPDCKTLKMCIEEDFHYETDAAWHKSMGFKVVLQKHYSQFLRKLEVPFESFPFSVDVNIFNPRRRIERPGLHLSRISSLQRKNKLCFAGTSEEHCYPQRHYVYTNLAERGLLDAYVQRNGTRLANTALYGEAYIDCLKNYVSHVSCGSKYNLTSAKNFEIMASGSVLFTNRFTGIEAQLDPGSYVTYENDYSDLFQKANQILNDPILRDSVVGRATHCIYTRHTHSIRIQEFLNLVEKYK